MKYGHRLATHADLPAIVAIYNSAIPDRTASCDLEPVSVASREEWFAGSAPESRPIWVAYSAEAPERVTGYLSFGDFLNGRAGYRATAELAIYLHPEHRGHGQGDHLLGEAVRAAPDLGIRNLAATILAHNEPSIRLFRSHGFRDWGRFPAVAELDGVERDVVMLGRHVDGPAR